jgi:hypothetical protein
MSEENFTQHNKNLLYNSNELHQEISLKMELL